MNDFFARLAERVRAPQAAVEPRAQPWFESGGLEEVEVEHTVEQLPTVPRSPEIAVQPAGIRVLARGDTSDTAAAAEPGSVREAVAEMQSIRAPADADPPQLDADPGGVEAKSAEHEVRPAEEPRRPTTPSVTTVARTSERLRVEKLTLAERREKAAERREKAAPHERAELADESREVRVHIGRVEVRAVFPSAPAPPPAPRKPTPPHTTLDAFLNRRRGNR
jgi:hypothetical protein